MASRGVTFFFAFLAILFAWNGTATSDPGSDEPLMVGAAQPMTLPLTTAASSPGNVTIPNEMIGSFGYVSGFIGSGETDPVQIIVPLSETHVTANDAASENNTELTQIRVRNFGTSMLPFSTQRADLEVRGKELFKTNNLYPYRATGLLDFCTSSPCSSDANRYYCTASLIGPSVLITAAHCVAPYEKKTIYYTDGKFTPGYRAVIDKDKKVIDAPYGVWKVVSTQVQQLWLDGNDCAEVGVVCAHDFAVLRLETHKDEKTGENYWLGQRTGWYSFGYNLAGFAPDPDTGVMKAQISQLGYPGCLDNGNLMQRTDTQGQIRRFSNNTIFNIVFGSIMCGGSSGGPLITNFGSNPFLTLRNAPLGASGYAWRSNMLVGVTNYGTSDRDPRFMRQGASVLFGPGVAESFIYLWVRVCKQDWWAACGVNGNPINLLQATWGRPDLGEQGGLLDVTDQVRQICTTATGGRPSYSCTFDANDSSLPNPGGSAKMLSYNWNCGGPQTFQGITLEGNKVNLYCPSSGG